ncbi:MAG: SOS response-associated peptidase [Chloroflexota bacterium]|nr:SOS response-associated peptidase [Chloroflexota bacterium]
MCGRYVLKGNREFSERFQLRQVNLGLFTTYNAAPSQQLPVVLQRDGEREVDLLRWGLLPRWSKPGSRTPEPINARAETLLEKPMFRSLVKSKRCLVPANGFYEWKRTGGPKQPYFIRPTDQETFAFAGLYDETKGEDGEPIGSYAIITTAPNELMASLHDRMPVVLRPEDEEEWLDPSITDPGIVALLRPYPAEAMAADPVSTAVNNTRNDGPELIQPLPS